MAFVFVLPFVFVFVRVSISYISCVFSVLSKIAIV